VELQQGLAARAHDEAAGTRRSRSRPGRQHGSREGSARVEPPTTGTVRADEVRVAEAAPRRGAIFLAPGPQIAARESQQHRGAPDVGPLALERVVDLLHGVGVAHPETPVAARYRIGSGVPASAKPF